MDTAIRHKLPVTRKSVIHKFSIDGTDGYLCVGLYEDGTPGELFINMEKEGSTLGGMVECFATACSIALQHGVPLETLVAKFTYQQFEPCGSTQNPCIQQASSVVDYVFRWLKLQFLDQEAKVQAA